MTCTTLVAGCRALSLAYNASNRLTTVTATLWNPDKSGGAGVDSVVVATYAYDGSGRLVSVSDPRVGLTTSYTYDGTTPRLASVTPPGLATWRFDYTDGPVNGFTYPHLTRVRRDPATGTGAAVTVSSFVYGVPVTGTAALADLADLSGATADEADGGWRQAVEPTQGFAVFGADRVSTGDTPDTVTTTADWQRASLQYTDGVGQVVNTAVFGAGAWQLSATDYDTNGHEVRSISPAGFEAWALRKTTLGTSNVSMDPYATVTAYNSDITATSAIIVTNPDETTRTIPAGTVIVPAGTRVTDEWGPVRSIPRGSGVAEARPHMRTTYDEGAPNSGIDSRTGLSYSLPTTVRNSVWLTDITTPGDAAAISVTQNSYDAVDGSAPAGGTSGWIWGTPTAIRRIATPDLTPQAGANPLTDNVQTRILDNQGRVVQTRQPSESAFTAPLPAAGAGTMRALYYTATAQTAPAGDPDCGDKPQWNGLVCASGPVTPSGTVMTTKVDAYSAWLAPSTVVATTASGATRTTTTQNHANGRPIHNRYWFRLDKVHQDCDAIRAALDIP